MGYEKENLNKNKFTRTTRVKDTFRYTFSEVFGISAYMTELTAKYRLKLRVGLYFCE